MVIKEIFYTPAAAWADRSDRQVIDIKSA